MCLEPEFFDAREATIAARAGKGDLEIESFMESRGIPFERLVDLGYLKNEVPLVLSTADLFTEKIAPAGRPFLLAKKDLQLIFVRAGKVVELAGRLVNQLRPQDPLPRT